MADDLLQRLDEAANDTHYIDHLTAAEAAARIRELEAQIAAPAVRVKPLVWGVDHHGRRYHDDATRAECPIFGQVCAERPTDQADVEARRAARILATIETVPAATVRDAALDEVTARIAAIAAIFADQDDLQVVAMRACAAEVRAMKGGAK